MKQQEGRVRGAMASMKISSESLETRPYRIEDGVQVVQWPPRISPINSFFETLILLILGLKCYACNHFMNRFSRLNSLFLSN